MSVRGNPFTDIEPASRFITHHLRSLQILDGAEVSDRDRDAADNQFSRSSLMEATNEASHAKTLAAEYKGKLEVVK